MTDKRQWLGGAAVLCLAVLALGFMFVVKPQHTKASNVKTQTAAVDAQVNTLRAQLAQLKQEQQGIVGEQAKLAAYAAQLPANPQVPTLLRKVQDAATNAHVELLSLNPGNPTPLVGATTTAATAAPSTGVYTIPVSMSVGGSYYDLEQFLDSIEGLQRSMLVNTFDIAYNATDQTTTGTPALGAGEIKVSISASVFMAPSLGTTGAAGSSTTTTTGGTASGNAAS